MNLNYKYMKKVLVVLLGIFMLTGCGDSNSYSIKGKIEGAKDGTAYLKSYQGGRSVPVDTAELKNGKFKFTGSVDAPVLHLIYINNLPMPIAFFLENKDITITASVDSLDKAVIKGSPETDLFIEFNKGMPSLKRSMEIRQDFMKAQTARDTARLRALSQEIDSIREKQKNYYIDFVNSHTNSVVGAFLASQMFQAISPDEQKNLVDEYEKNIGDHPYVTDMKNTMKSLAEIEQKTKATAIGREAPGFTLKTKDGKDINLADFRGKYVLLDFWASWCQPCRRENPNSVKAYKAFNSKGFEILGISLDKDRNAWIKAVKDDGLLWTQVIDPDGNVARQYNVSSIPSTFLLDKDGKIIAKNLRGEALVRKLNEILNK